MSTGYKAKQCLTKFRQMFWVDKATGRLDDCMQIYFAIKTESIAVTAARVPLYVQHTVPRVVTASHLLYRTLATYTACDITPQQCSFFYFIHKLYFSQLSPYQTYIHTDR